MTKKRKKRKYNPVRLAIVIAFLGLILTAMIYVSLKFIPVFVSIEGKKHMTIEVNSEYVEYGAVSTFSKEPLPAEGEVDTSKLGTYKIAYRSGPQTLYRTVKVVDTQAPVISFADDELFISLNSQFTDTEYTVSDNYDADLYSSVVVKGTVNTQKTGNYKLLYSVKDSSGNKSAEVSRIVHVVDDDFQYLDKINNKTPANDRMLKVITDYMNLYYKSMKYLHGFSTDELFSEKAANNAYLSKKAIEAMVEMRRASVNDLHMDDCSFTLNVKEIRDIGDGVIRITITEDSILKFRFLNGLESRQGSILNYFYLIKENNAYKLTDVFHEESFYLAFYNSYKGNGPEEIDAIKQTYLETMVASRNNHEQELKKANNGETYKTVTAAHSYDRDKAREYAVKYGNARNNSYGSYQSNCVNFVSQCMHAGGIPMDSRGQSQWKYYSKIHDESTAGYGYSYSWTYIPSFADYLENGNIVSVQNINLYLGEAGDVLYIDTIDRGLEESPHIVLVSKQVKDQKGKILDLLICGNTNDQVDYPLSAAGYPYKKLIKIIGYNDE